MFRSLYDHLCQDLALLRTHGDEAADIYTERHTEGTHRDAGGLAVPHSRCRGTRMTIPF